MKRKIKVKHRRIGLVLMIVMFFGAGVYFVGRDMSKETLSLAAAESFRRLFWGAEEE